MEAPLNTTLPTVEQIAYTPPSLPTLLSISAYLVLLSLPTLMSDAYPSISHPMKIRDHAKNSSIFQSLSSKRSYTLSPALTILLPLFVGALLGPSITSASILSTSTQRTLIDIGYIGLLLLIFEAGVSVDVASLKLMRENAGLSVVVALTGVLLPIALSMGLGIGAYGYGALQSFASGAALSSTSLGTTLALLNTSGAEEEKDNQLNASIDLRRTRVGCVLVCAALLDDILGLVIAGIIPGLAEQESGTDAAKIQWPTIVRPILTSIAFALGTPVLAILLRKAMTLRVSSTKFRGRMRNLHKVGNGTRPASSMPPARPQVIYLFIIFTLFAFVAGSGYAGTSELFGAYLAGTVVGHVFQEKEEKEILSESVDGAATSESRNPAHEAFMHYLQPVLTHLLAPIFFASIGTALPIKAMFRTFPSAMQLDTVIGAGNTTITVEIQLGKASHEVIWRGLIYAVLMVLAKMAVGLWIFVWPDPKYSNIDNDRRELRRTIPMLKSFRTKSGRARPESSEGEATVRVSGSREFLPHIIPRGAETSTAVTLTTPKQLDRGLEFPSCQSIHGEPGPSTSPASIAAVPQLFSPPSSSVHRQPSPHVIDNVPDRQLESGASSPLETIKTNMREPTRVRSALLLGIAMVARGEIALIIAQLARPLLLASNLDVTTSTSVSDSGTVITTTTKSPIPDEQVFAVVIWAVLVSTIGGALGVGMLIATWRRRDDRNGDSHNQSPEEG